jgi:type I restriction enzyme S subunit
LTSGSRGWADYYSDEGDVFIRAQNLRDDRLDLTDVAFVKLPAGSTEGVRTKVRLGDVLITITGANVTKTGFVDRDCGTAYVSQHVALCRPGPLVLPEFLYWYLLSEADGRRQLNKAAYGAGKPGLNLDNIRNVRIPLPSLSEQGKVITLIRAAIEAENRLNTETVDALRRLEILRQSILKSAFSGQLVAHKPSDEHVSIVLGRSREETKASRRGRAKKIKNGDKEAA